MDDRAAIDHEVIEEKIRELLQQHADLDDAITLLAGGSVFDQLKVQRMKKHKLSIKDQIRILEDMLIPDIIA